MTESRLPHRAVAGAIVVVAMATLVLTGLDAPIGQGDEVIYAENVREMQRTGDWGVLTYAGVPGLLRPAAPFVPVAWVSQLVDGEVGLRLVSALCCLGILALCFATARAIWGRDDLGLLAVVLCASAPTYFLFSRSLLSDPPLVLCTTFALYATVRAQHDPRWLCGAAAGLGAGVAVKSLAAAVPGLALLPWLVAATWRHRPWRIVILASALFMALAAPYFVYSYLRFGEQFLDEHIGRSLGSRASGNTRVGMTGGIAGYMLHVFRNDGVVTALWMTAGGLGGGWLAWRRRDLGLAIATVYGLVVFAVLSLIGTRLGHYLLPAYPAMAIAAAGVVGHLPAPRTLRPALVKALVATLAVTVLLVGLSRPLGWVFLPSVESVALGRDADRALAPEQPVYSLDWYAPALGYYADRPWHMISRSRDIADFLQGVYLFEKADNIHFAPPWPSGRFALAATREQLATVPLTIDREIAEDGDFVLVIASSPPGANGPR